MHFIYHDGTVRDADTFDQMYMKKPQKQLVRVAFQPGFYIDVNSQTNEMKTTDYWDVSQPLRRSGTNSQIVWAWEILKIFFDNNNVVPKWIVGDYNTYFDAESRKLTSGLIPTVRYTRVGLDFVTIQNRILKLIF